MSIVSLIIDSKNKSVLMKNRCYISNAILIGGTTIKKTICGVLIICIMLLLVACGRSKAESLANFGEAEFLAHDFDDYLERLQECGLSDLVVEASTSYDYEYDYDKENKILNLRCVLTNFTSNEIDKFYTTDYDSAIARSLAELMIAIENACEPTKYTYQMDDGSTVVVSVSGPSNELHIHASSGRDYEYSFYVSYDNILIDGDYVYMEQSRDESGASSKGYEVTVGNRGRIFIRCTNICDDDCGNGCRDCFMNTFGKPPKCKFDYEANSETAWIGCPGCGDVTYERWYAWYKEHISLT